MKRQSGIFIFNIIPAYRPGLSDVFDQLKAASLPTSAQRVKQNTLFTSLEDICGDCLSDLDLFYNFATDGDDEFAMINWGSPGTFQLTKVGTVTKTTNSDFQGNGTNGHFTTGYTASTHAGSYTQNDASAFCSVISNVASSGQFDFGCNGGGSDPSILFNSRNASNQHQGRINSTIAEPKGTGVSSVGFFQIQRTASGTSKIFNNGSQVGTDLISVSLGVPNRALPLLANNNNGAIQSFSVRKMGCFGLGASLSGQESTLYNAWNTYVTSL